MLFHPKPQWGLRHLNSPLKKGGWMAHKHRNPLGRSIPPFRSSVGGPCFDTTEIFLKAERLCGQNRIHTASGKGTGAPWANRGNPPVTPSSTKLPPTAHKGSPGRGPVYGRVHPQGEPIWPRLTPVLANVRPWFAQQPVVTGRGTSGALLCMVLFRGNSGRGALGFGLGTHGGIPRSASVRAYCPSQ